MGGYATMWEDIRWAVKGQSLKKHWDSGHSFDRKYGLFFQTPKEQDAYNHLIE